jgi:LPXTG-motif cell wall-anchored protein
MAAAIGFTAVAIFPAALAAQEGPEPGEAPAEIGTAPQARAGGGSAAAKGTNSVEIRNFKFRPKTVTIDAGDRVRWRNEDADDHTATARDGSFDTGILSENESATEEFDDAGTFRYICEIHPSMKGTVEVEAESGGGSDPEATSAPSGSIEDPIPPSDSSALGSSDGSGSTADSGGSLPSTGEEELPLFALGAALLAAGLLVGAAAAWAEWAR